MTAKTNLTINPQRLWDALMETATFGGTPKGGIKRLTVSDEDKKVRDWFKAECEKLGCAVVVDDRDRAHAGGSQVQQRGRAETTGTDHQRVRGRDALLALDADVVQQDVARITQQLLVVHAGPP